MESTGERDRIQLSETTAALVRAVQPTWVTPRAQKVHAKGKGELQTYWYESSNRRRSMGSVSSEDDGQSRPKSSVIWGEDDEAYTSDDNMSTSTTQRSKHMRLIDYNTDLLAQLLKSVVARRRVMDMAGCVMDETPPQMQRTEGHVIDEVTEVINLPDFDANAYRGYVDPESIQLGATVLAQLKRYITIIAAMYRNNPFHVRFNLTAFLHSSHYLCCRTLNMQVMSPCRSTSCCSVL